MHALVRWISGVQMVINEQNRGLAAQVSGVVFSTTVATHNSVTHNFAKCSLITRSQELDVESSVSLGRVPWHAISQDANFSSAVRSVPSPLHRHARPPHSFAPCKAGHERSASFQLLCEQQWAASTQLGAAAAQHTLCWTVAGSWGPNAVR